MGNVASVHAVTAPLHPVLRPGLSVSRGTTLEIVPDTVEESGPAEPDGGGTISLEALEAKVKDAAKASVARLVSTRDTHLMLANLARDEIRELGGKLEALPATRHHHDERVLLENEIRRSRILQHNCEAVLAAMQVDIVEERARREEIKELMLRREAQEMRIPLPPVPVPFGVKLAPILERLPFAELRRTVEDGLIAHSRDQEWKTSKSIYGSCRLALIHDPRVSASRADLPRSTKALITAVALTQSLGDRALRVARQAASQASAVAQTHVAPHLRFITRVSSSTFVKPKPSEAAREVEKYAKALANYHRTTIRREAQIREIRRDVEVFQAVIAHPKNVSTGEPDAAQVERDQELIQFEHERLAAASEQLKNDRKEIAHLEELYRRYAYLAAREA